MDRPRAEWRQRVEITTFVIGPLQSNCYLVTDEASGGAVVIDPGMESGEVLEAVRRKRLRLETVIVTHGHFDHVFSSALF